MPQENKDVSIDWRFIKTIFDLREYFKSFTFRKSFFYLIYLLSIGLIFSLEFTVGFSDYIVPLVKSNILPLMLFLYVFEPVLTLASMTFTEYPSLNLAAQTVNEEELPIDNKEINKEIAIIIPAHNSATEITATLQACLQIVQPQQIFVIDNGNSILPTDNTLAVIRQLSSDIHYYWHHRGNKTIAQYIGALLAHDYPYCLAIDDDVHPPADFLFDKNLIQNEFKGIIYPIRAISDQESHPLLVRWQDIEYQQSDHFKLFENRFYGALYPHGAVCLWDRKSWLKILRQHDTRFIAEDLQTGLISERLGFKKHLDCRYYFPTLAPTTLLGTAPNLYQQRARGWGMGVQTMNGQLIRNFLTQWPTHPAALTVLKTSQLYGLYNNAVDWTRLAVTIISASDPLYWGKLAAVIAGQQATTLLWHYVKLRNRPDLQHNFPTLFSMFFYRLLQIGLTNISLVRLLLVYLPNLKPTPSIIALEQLGDFKELSQEMETDIEQPIASTGSNIFTFFKTKSVITDQAQVIEHDNVSPIMA